MSVQFKCEVQYSTNEIVVIVSGAFNETAKLPNLTDNRRVIFDLDRLIHINSPGVVIWIKWFKQHSWVKEIHLRHCRPQIVRTFNTIASFLLPNTVVDSFYVTYYNEAKDERYDQLFVLGVDYNLQGMVKAKPSLKVGADVYELDVIPDTYFPFLQRG